MLNIAVIAHLKHAIREPFAGGLEMHTQLLCRELRTRGHSVTLFAATGSDDAGLERVCDPMHAVRESFSAEHYVYSSIMQSLSDRSFDIVHNNSLHYLPVTLAAALPIPMVTTLHTPPFWELEGSMRLSRAPHHCYVAVSNVIGRAWHPIVSASRTVSNGINLEDFAFRNVPDDEAYVIWTGRIVPEKGLHLAMDAARLAGLPLRFAGPIAHQAYYDTQIAPRMTDRIRYLGHIGHAELAVAIGGARAFLCTPMWEEPYGLVVAEALACGTPVAAFARGAIPDLLDASCGLTVPVDDACALAAAALAVQSLDRAACRRRAETVADGQRMMDHYERLYEVLIRRYPRTRRAMPIGPNAAWIDPTNASLIDLYTQRVPSMVCQMPVVS